MIGKFIVFEGGEGSGKTFQIALLQKKLKKLGKKVIVTHEPGGTALAEQIRHVILFPQKKKPEAKTELFLFLASRQEHVVEKLIPALKKGYYVLCDRFSGSTLAYQIGARGLKDEKLIIVMDKFAKNNLKEDLVIYLDVDPKIGLARRKKDTLANNLTSFDKETLTFHNKVRKYFNKLVKNNKNWVKINANKTLSENETEIYEIISKKIK
ncbi:MAG: dTMP kinase [Patescibacteria group bacterium]